MPNPALDTSSHKKPKRGLSWKILRRDFSLGRDKSRSKDSKSSSKGTVESDYEDSFFHRTKIITQVVESPSKESCDESVEEMEPIEETNHYSCATAILGHNYLECICGVPESSTFDGVEDRTHRHREMPEDPTVQESIECIFASQLEDGLQLWDDAEYEEHERLGSRKMVDISTMQSPSRLQQSRLNRADRGTAAISQSKKRYEQASLVYVGTFDPSIPDRTPQSPGQPIPCACATSKVPNLDPIHWPQGPLLLRPSPGQGTRIKGIRMGEASKDYFWEPGSHMTWSESLAQHWGKPVKTVPRVACCEHCVTVPMNNGNEAEGESLIVDFESNLFEGSLLLRLRHSNGSTRDPYDDNKGYFKGMNRRYQALVRGRFKKSIPMTALRTGFQFDRPCGKLPAKWILRGGIKVLSFFAPQLDAKLECSKPHTLTPLGSTPQSITVDDGELTSLEGAHDEPEDGKRSLLGVTATSGQTTMQRARVRKKAFDKLFVHQSKEPMTDPSKVYTFEFLQHLFNFQDFSIELGSMLGSVHLQDILDGQPLQVMATHEEERLWSFDLWHESLLDKARQSEAQS